MLTAVPLLIWFVLPSLAHQLSSTSLPRLTVLHYIKNSLWGASFFIFFESFWDNLMYLIPVAGCVAFLVHKPRPAVFCLLLGAVPFAIVLLMAPGYPMQSWHAAWVTPLVSLFSAMAFSWLPWRKAISPFLAVGGAALILIYQYNTYYEPPSDQNVVDFRATAVHLEPLLSHKTLTVDVSYPGFFNALSWYFDQLPSNPLQTQSLDPGSTPITLYFVFGSLFDNQQQTGEYSARSIQTAMGEQGQVTQARNATVYSFPWTASRQQPLIAYPRLLPFQQTPKHFIAMCTGYAM